MWTIFNASLNLLQYCFWVSFFFFYALVSWLQVVWVLGYPTKVQTCTLWIGRWSLKQLTREVLNQLSFNCSGSCIILLNLLSKLINKLSVLISCIYGYLLSFPFYLCCPITQVILSYSGSSVLYLLSCILIAHLAIPSPWHFPTVLCV